MSTSDDSMAQVLLASQSPRRAELLRQINVNFIVQAMNIDESRRADEDIDAYVLRLAHDKACAGRACAPALAVLGADTIVVCDNDILQKPRDEEDAVAMLQRLSNRRHDVLTSVAVAKGEQVLCRLSRSEVHFRAIDEREARAYWHTCEPWDKAGGYGIQGLAAVFVERIEGSYSGIMGLPLFETAQLLQAFHVPCWHTQ